MVDVAGQAVVAVLTRAPSSGGKSRLFAALGRRPDPDLPAALLLDTLEAIGAAGGSTRVVCFTPIDAAAEMRALVPAGVGLLPQGGGDLGARMRRAFEELLAAGARSVVLVGSDLPLIEPASIAEAHAHVAADPDALVLGPAADGGYYLIGAARVYPWLFEGLPWGAPTICTETRMRAEARSVRVQLVACAADVDTPDDLRRIAAEAGARAARTLAWVARRL